MMVMAMMAMMSEMTVKAMAEDRGVDEDGRWRGGSKGRNQKAKSESESQKENLRKAAAAQQARKPSHRKSHH